jgi:hypothetical protein
MASANYNRMGFKEEKADVKDTMIEEFTSPLVAELRANGGSVSGITLFLSAFKRRTLSIDLDKACIIGMRKREAIEELGNLTIDRAEQSTAIVLVTVRS